MQPDDLHQMARSGMVQEAENFFKELADSDAQQAANAVDDKQRSGNAPRDCSTNEGTKSNKNNNKRYSAVCVREVTAVCA